MVYKVWHWLPNLQPKKHNYFWLQLALFSLLGHLILLLIALGSHKRTNMNLTVFSSPRGIEVVFVPLYKKVPMVQDKINQAKLAQASVETSVTTGAKKKQPVLAKSEQKKTVKKLPVKTNLTKKPEKKVQAKKNIPKKTVLKIKDPVSKVKPELKPEIKPVPIESLEKSVEKNSEQIVLPNEPIYVGRQDLKELQMFGELEQVLIQNWQPPVGFGADVECIVELVSGLSGEIISLEIKKSSKILAYDMSVRRNFNGMILPKSAANKTFTIVFKP